MGQSALLFLLLWGAPSHDLALLTASGAADCDGRHTIC